MPKTLKKLLKSHKTALKGIMKVYNSELSFRIQFWTGVIVITQTFYWPIGEMKRLILLLLIALILLAEILNTTFEKLFDMIEKRYNNQTGYLKDILSGGVLIAAIASATIGIIIFWPYILPAAIAAAAEAVIIIILLYLIRQIHKIRPKH